MGYLPTLDAGGTGNILKKQTSGFYGLNLTGNASDSQLTDCKNIVTTDIPALTVRGKTKFVKQYLTETNAVMKAFRFDDSICTIRTDFSTFADCCEYTFDGDIYNYNMGGSVARCLKNDFSVVKFKDYILLPYYDSENSRVCLYMMSHSPLTSAFVTIAKDVEKQEDNIHIVAFNNRLMCVYSDAVWICYEDDFVVWDKFYVEGSEQGSAEINAAACQNIPLAAGGHFTACAYYKDKPMIFKEHAMYALYGSYTPFSIVKIADVGCISHESIQVIGDDLIFLSENGLMKYSGGTPYCISDEIPELQYQTVTGCCATDKYYFINEYMYDVNKKCFTKLEQRLIPLCAYKNRVFFYDRADGKSLEMVYDDETDEVIDWSFTTRIYHENYAEKKRYSKLKVRIEALEESSAAVSYSIDGKDFVIAAQQIFSKPEGRIISLNIPLCDSFQLKLSGTGRVKVPFIEREYRAV